MIGFNERYKPIFRRAFNLLEKYQDVITHDEWAGVSEEIAVYEEGLESDIIVAVVNELERTYTERKRNGGF